MRGTKLWQPPGSPMIQGRSRTFVPFWRDLLGALLVCGVTVALYDWAISEPYGFAPSEAREFAAAFAIGSAVGIPPALLIVWITRLQRAHRPWLIAGLASAALAVGLAVLYPRVFA